MMLRNRKQNDPNRGKYIGVGGKTEENESPEECLLREVSEETGLTLDNYRYRGIITFVSDCTEGEYMHLFTSESWHGTLNYDCDEGELCWVKKSEISTLPLWEGDKVFLNLLETQRNFFSVKLTYNGNDLINVKVNKGED